MAQDGSGQSPWIELVAGASVLHQQALTKLDVPALTLELPSRRVLAANEAVATLFGTPVDQLIGRINDELIEFEDVDLMKRAVAAVNDGSIDGYRAHRHFTAHDGKKWDTFVWCRAFDLDGKRYAAYIISPIPAPGDATHPFETPVAWSGPMVVGKVDAQWHIGCVSSDVRDMFGRDADETIGLALLGYVHPDDVGGLLRAAEAAAASETGATTALHVRLRHANGQWVPVVCMLLRLREPESAFAFAAVPDSPSITADADRLVEMENRLRRIVAELRAAGVLDDVSVLPTVKEFPQLTSLSARQWQILARLLRGERVPMIARELFLSQGTVRNHLTAIFERFNVHSQAELVATLRRR